jgi:hypothetical protein
VTVLWVPGSGGFAGDESTNQPAPQSVEMGEVKK